MACNATNLIGKQFGRLQVVRRGVNSRHGAARWDVQCECGVEKTVRSDQLTKGTTVSCGCFARELASARKTTHGMTHTFEFRAWMAMRRRCTYEKHPAYFRYGGAGIKVCTRWDSFEKFLEDMGGCPFSNGSIDRKNNKKGYSPANCRWLPKTQQSKNRDNVPLYEGSTLPELALKNKIKYSTLRRRVLAGWPRTQWFKTPTELGTRK
jgi:hypothetical protein